MEQNPQIGMRSTTGTSRTSNKLPWIISAVLLVIVGLAALGWISNSYPLQSLTSEQSQEAR